MRAAPGCRAAVQAGRGAASGLSAPSGLQCPAQREQVSAWALACMHVVLPQATGASAAFQRRLSGLLYSGARCSHLQHAGGIEEVVAVHEVQAAQPRAHHAKHAGQRRFVRVEAVLRESRGVPARYFGACSVAVSTPSALSTYWSAVRACVTRSQAWHSMAAPLCYCWAPHQNSCTLCWGRVAARELGVMCLHAWEPMGGEGAAPCASAPEQQGGHGGRAGLQPALHGGVEHALEGAVRHAEVDVHPLRSRH